jgi:hypothetical protein
MTIALHNRKNPCGEIALPMGNNLPRPNTMSQLMSGDRSYFYTPYMPTFTKPKYQFSRTNWYVAHYAALDGELGHTQVFQWCEDNFGPMVHHPDAWSRWATGAAWSTIRFRDERDYMWFTLRWSS